MQMVQVFQRYIPFGRLLDFMIHSLLCATAFTAVVQVACGQCFSSFLPTSRARTRSRGAPSSAVRPTATESSRPSEARTGGIEC